MQAVIYLEFVLADRKAKWEGFTNMGRAAQLFKSAPEIAFYRALGTGGGNGFSFWPDFSRYGFILTLHKGQSPQAFIDSNDLIRWYIHNSSSHFIALMNPLKAHGLWDGLKPFETDEPLFDNPRVAVLTRAKVRGLRLVEFWKNVPSVSRFMKGQKEAIYQTGVGEYPLMMQATLSIWTSRSAMRDAAYKNNAHGRVVKLTRDRKWYSEELFAEFEVQDITAVGDRYAALILPAQNQGSPN